MQEIYTHTNAFEGKARTYRPQRARTRARQRIGGFTIEQHERLRMAEEKMEEDTPEPQDSEPAALIERNTLCLPNFDKNTVAHQGDDGFQDALRQYFPSVENVQISATERLMNLKSKLRTASTHEFWALLMEEMCEITEAQTAFVAKRMLVDDQDSAVEMPPLGEPGSCLMGVAYYFNTGKVKHLQRDYRYHAYGTACAHMRHDKVFIIPEKLSLVCPDLPSGNSPPFTPEAFIGVPLFAEGKSFAHFGLIWSVEGARERKLSWSYIEMFMHALEDMIVQRVLEGKGFAKEVPPPDPVKKPLIPLSAITASQSLKPYARSLSHELRTPMQGVIGMLDIMYSTVLEAFAFQENETVRSVFAELKNHIEVVQDSSKRAVEAADNVVHAYDLNMEMPETPLSRDDEAILEVDSNGSVMDTDTPQRASTKRKFSLSLHTKREPSEEIDFHPGPPLKKMFTMTEEELLESYYKQPPSLISAGQVATSDCLTSGQISPREDYFSRTSPVMVPKTSPTQRRIITRDFMRTLVHDTLHSGHLTSEVHIETTLGETIKVQTPGPKGEVQERMIELKIEPNVPIAMITEEQHLHFSLQKIIDNAIKFTESGSITITVKMGKSSLVEIWVVDTGCGITQESQEYLFRPHFQEDASIRRARDGLGLSLFNAKAHVRKSLGGDVTLERSATEGKERGSSFLIRLPIISTTATPLVGMPTADLLKEHRRTLPRSTPSVGSTTISSPATKPAIDRQLRFEAASRISHAKTSLRRGQPPNPNLAKDYPLNLLIAEDNAINRSVAVAALSKLGYTKDHITLAFDGVEAVRYYNDSLSKPSAQRFDIILMDIWMPNMDGYEATARIMDLAGRNGEETTIIAVTADITSECIEKAKEVGMQRFLAKPYKVCDIENLIKEQFSRSDVEAGVQCC